MAAKIRRITIRLTQKEYDFVKSVSYAQETDIVGALRNMILFYVQCIRNKKLANTIDSIMSELTSTLSKEKQRSNNSHNKDH
jgi:ribosome-associated translation inhibitor RaiA